MNWVRYFEKNRAERRNIPWERGIRLDPHLREPLARSLQRFQIGESGEGRHMKRWAAATGDADYAHAVHLFIAEEQAHASMMARILEQIGKPLLKGHWSDVCFITLRRLMGLNLEVMVLLGAEIVGKHYFKTLYLGIDDPVLRGVFAQIVHDEDGHVAFQSDHLRKTFAKVPRLFLPLLRAAWWVIYQAAFLVVVYDHRHILRALSVSSSEFMRDCDATFAEVSSMMFHRAAAAGSVAEEGEVQVV